MASLILALDQGTTSSRTLLFDLNSFHAATSLASAQQEFPQYYPSPGWVEHNPMEIWESQYTSLQEAISKAKKTAQDIAAIGIANQRETTLLWERDTGVPLAPAIVWQDRRTAEYCATLRDQGLEPEITERTGLLLDPYFSATKLAWLLDHVPDARKRAQRGELCFGTVDSWLVWKLTQGRHHVTDLTNASRTLLLNIDTGAWDERLLKIFDIPLECLPRVISSWSEASIQAKINGVEIPITGVAGDQQAALFGQACLEPGMAKNTYGTGCFMLMHTGDKPQRSAHRLLTTLACSTQPLQYALEGSVFVGGAVVQWLRDGLGFIQHASEIEALATSVQDHGGVYIVPAFTGLGSPHWDPFARGSMVGITRGTTRGHIARAALEAIAFQSAELLLAMSQDASQGLNELRVDGGASRNNFLMQFQADLLGVPVLRPRMTETTALGAAYLAGLGIGFWNSPKEIAKSWQIERIFEPHMTRDYAGQRMHEWSRALERSRNWITL